MDTSKLKSVALAVLKAIGLAVIAAITKELWEGQPLTGLAKLKSYQHLLTSNTPTWQLLVTLFVIGLLLPYWWRAIRRKNSELHLAWHGSAGWGIGGLLKKEGMEQVLRIQGPVLISSSNLDEPATVTGIELRGADFAGPNFQMLELKPGETVHRTFLLNFRREKPAPGIAFKAEFTLIDIKGKRYPLKPAMLRAFPGLDIPPVEPPSPKPVINTSWRISSWCWAQIGSERVVRLVLEGLTQFTGIPGRIIVTGARINGLDVVGAFDTFPAEPDKEFYRSISLNVRGLGSAGKVPIKAAITLTDLQGNEYPLGEETFTPYDEPTRWVGGLAWPKP